MRVLLALVLLSAFSFAETAFADLPDLSFESVSIAPESFVMNDVVVTAIVKNRGKTASEGFFTYLYAMPTYIRNADFEWKGDCILKQKQNSFVESLGPGETAEVVFKLNCKKAGAKEFLVKTDFFNRVREWNEKNNIALIATRYTAITKGECRDSDNGMEPFSKGTIVEGTKKAQDVCSGNVLREYYCKDGKIAYTTITCDKKCLDGTCTLD